jgi:1,2-diacylglycerol 3-beta-galactosyltransferase
MSSNPRAAVAADTAPHCLADRAVPLLFVTSVTGGGHGAAAAAVAQALDRLYPGSYAPITFDPLAGPGSARTLRWVARRYGWLIRCAPPAWGLLYRFTNSQLAARLVHQAIARLASRTLTDVIAGCKPAAIVSFHPLLGQAAIRARDAAAPGAAAVTVITDLTRAHATWTWPKADQVVAAADVGVPVGSASLAAPPSLAERAAQRGRLGHSRATFLVLLAGGAEGAGRLSRKAAAIARRLPDVDVAVMCGRNRLLYWRLRRRVARYGGRLSVHGFVENMGSWLRAADVVVTKAGPATIAESACCGTAIALTGYLPGQERGNVHCVTAAGAGMYWPSVSQLIRGLAWLRADPGSLTSMRASAARLAKPYAAYEVAALIADAACAAMTPLPMRER